MRSPLKEVMTIYDVSREKGQVIRLPDAVNYLIQAYGNYEILYSSNNGGIDTMPFEPPPISEPDPECIGSDYYANDNGYHYLTKDKVYVQLTDFRIKVTKRRIKTNVNVNDVLKQTSMVELKTKGILFCIMMKALNKKKPFCTINELVIGCTISGKEP